MPHAIASAANPSVKMLRALHTKKGRNEAGLFLAEGERLAREAAALGVWPEVMAVGEAALQRPSVRALVDRAERAGVRVLTVTARLLEQISRRENPQSVLGAYRPHWAPLDALRAGDLALALHEVRDPGNLGAVLRTCDAVGAAGVALTGTCCDPYSVEAVRASMGAIFAVAIARATFEEMNEWRKGAGFILIGTSLKAQMPHDAPDVRGPVMILMGAEQSGLPAEAEAACDALVRIPMRGRADSLNLAVAASLMLYDVWRRRGYAGA